jgi:hypothetical protein
MVGIILRGIWGFLIKCVVLSLVLVFYVKVGLIGMVWCSYPQAIKRIKTGRLRSEDSRNPYPKRNIIKSYWNF